MLPPLLEKQDLLLNKIHSSVPLSLLQEFPVSVPDLKTGLAHLLF